MKMGSRIFLFLVINLVNTVNCFEGENFFGIDFIIVSDNFTTASINSLPFGSHKMQASIMEFNSSSLGVKEDHECNQLTLVLVELTTISQLQTTLKQISQQFLDTQHVKPKPPKFIMLFRSFDPLQADAESMQNYLETNTNAWNFPVYSDVFLVICSKIQNRITGTCNQIFELYVLNGIHHALKHVARSPSFWPEIHYLLLKGRRANFNQTTIRAVGMNDPEYQLQCSLEVKNGSTRIVSGACKSIIETLAYSLNFSYEVINGEGWFEMVNGEVHGMGKQLVRDEADITISYLTMLKWRLKYITFFQPAKDSEVEVYFVQPKTRLTYLHLIPFSNQLWILLFFTWILIIVTTRVIVKLIQDHVYLELRGADIREGRFDELVLWALAIISQQGWYSQPKTTSLRIVMLFSLFLGSIIYIVYSASFVSNLSRKVVPIKTLNDLARSSINIVSDSAVPVLQSFTQNIYENNNVRYHNLPGRRLGETIHQFIDDTNKDVGIVAFPDGFLTTFRSIYEDSQYCEKISKFSLSPKLYDALVIKKGSPYKELFAQKIIKEFEIGINFRRVRKMQSDFSAGCAKRVFVTTSTRGLELLDFTIPYAILVVGFLLSLVFGGMEIFIGRNK